MNARCSKIVVAALLAAATSGCAGERSRWPSPRAHDPFPAPAAARTGADHEEIAAWYEREAAKAEERIAAHRRMLVMNASPYPDYEVSSFVDHCLNLLERYRLAADANRALSALHRIAASESAQ